MKTMLEKTDGGITTVSIRLGNQDFSLERKRVPIASLKLDPHNPRLTHSLRSESALSTDEALHKALWKQDAVKDLYHSIFNNGGLIEDPVVRRSGTVVEGNCRTVALRELQKKHPEDKRFETVFVKMLPEDVTEEQLMMLLGELHVAGKIRWGAYEEAEYVWKMQNLYNKTYDYLAAHLRWTRSKIAQKIGAYQETRQYIEETGDKNGASRFSHFEEFMKKKELRDRREKDTVFMRQFRKWVFEGKFVDAKDVRDLPAILLNDLALGKFLSGSMEDAKRVLYDENPSMVSSLYAVLDQATQELKTIPLTELEDLREGVPAKVQKLRELRQALENVVKHSDVEL